MKKREKLWKWLSDNNVAVQVDDLYFSLPSIWSKLKGLADCRLYMRATINGTDYCYGAYYDGGRAKLQNLIAEGARAFMAKAKESKTSES